MRISSWAGLPGLCHSTMRISTRLEDCLEALDEAADHGRDLVDCAGSDPADVGLALDGRAYEVGSGLKRVVGVYTRGEPTIQTGCPAVKVIESHIPSIVDLHLSAQLDPATSLKMP